MRNTLHVSVQDEEEHVVAFFQVTDSSSVIIVSRMVFSRVIMRLSLFVATQQYDFIMEMHNGKKLLEGARLVYATRARKQNL